MKTFSYTVLFVAFWVCIPTFFIFAETIPSFDARILVHENATIEVTEIIVYDFGDAEDKHGIFRHIPFSYQAGTETYIADISSVIVTDQHGEPRPFGESKGNGQLTLKIGDPNTTVKGEHSYHISYIVKGPFLYFDEFDELYWNVTGFWPLPIASSSVIVDLPRGVTVLNATCYKGENGSRTRCDYDEKLVNTERAGYTARAHNLGKQEGLTIAVAFPKGVIEKIEQPWKKKTVPPAVTYLPFLIPLIVLILMFNLWHKRGRDPEGRSVIVTEYAPPKDITPSVAGFVMDEMVHAEVITAEIVRLAVEGYIKIHRYENKVLLFTTKDFLIERVGEEVPKDPVLRMLLEKLFQSSFEETVEIQGEEVTGITLEKMKNKFVDEKKAVSNVVRQEGMHRKLFREQPKKVRIKYSGIAITLLTIGGMWFSSTLESGDVGYTGIAIIVSGLIAGIFAFIMPVKTIEGVRVKQHLEGFKRYLELAEKERLKFHDSPEREAHEPEKTMDIFNTFLPYAMVLGVEKEWVGKFTDIFSQAPKWYHNGTLETFSMSALTTSLGDFSKSVSTASAPRSSGSGGGGSSGGGFGGGGGGSW